MADTENLLLDLDIVIVVVFQFLFLAAETGAITENKNIGVNTVINVKTFQFIRFIITLIVSFKQFIIVVVVVVVIALISVTAIVLIKKQNQSNKNALEIISTSSPISTPISSTLLTWSDEAGFSFQYPEGVLIDKHPDDIVNYSNLTLTDSKQIGGINILMSDDIYKTLNKWIVSNAELKSGNIIDTTLDGKNGKKVFASTGIIIGVIDSEVLVTIKKDLNLSPLLENTWQKIIDTWTFIYPTPGVINTTQTTTIDDSDDILEEE